MVIGGALKFLSENVSFENKIDLLMAYLQILKYYLFIYSSMLAAIYP